MHLVRHSLHIRSRHETPLHGRRRGRWLLGSRWRWWRRSLLGPGSVQASCTGSSGCDTSMRGRGGSRSVPPHAFGAGTTVGTDLLGVGIGINGQAAIRTLCTTNTPVEVVARGSLDPLRGHWRRLFLAKLVWTLKCRRAIQNRPREAIAGRIDFSCRRLGQVRGHIASWTN